MDELAVLRWRRALGVVPRVSLGRWPTPVHRLRTLGSEESPIYVKRDDLSSPLGGGNKVRKLEYLLHGSDAPVITFGATGSHHVMATARHAASLGRETFGVLVPQAPSREVRENLKGTEEACRGVLRLDDPRTAMRRLIAAVPDAAGWLPAMIGAQVIPPGGSNALGALGYVGCGLELAEQVGLDLLPEPEEIYVPLGTGGTAAGLALGLALAGSRSTVIAVRVASVLAGNLRNLERLARGAFRLLARGDESARMPRLRLSVEHGFVGPGYGRPTEETAAVMARLAKEEIPLEIVYTAKAMAALLDRQRRRRPPGPVLFLDTFGPVNEAVPTNTRVEQGSRR